MATKLRHHSDKNQNLYMYFIRLSENKSVSSALLLTRFEQL